MGEPDDVLEPREVGGPLAWSEGGERIKCIAAGSIHTIAVTNTGKLYVADDNAPQVKAQDLPTPAVDDASATEVRRRLERGLWTHAGWLKPEAPKP